MSLTASTCEVEKFMISVISFNTQDKLDFGFVFAAVQRIIKWDKF